MMTTIALSNWMTGLSVEQGLMILLDASLKGLLVLIVAGLAAVMMRRKSAAGRHLVWLLALSSLLVIPLMSVALPGWQVLPSWIGGEAEVVGPLYMQQTGDMIIIGSGTITLNKGKLVIVPGPTESAKWYETLSGADVVGAVWLMGVVMFMVPLVLGQLSLWRLQRSAERIKEGDWIERLERASKQVGVQRQVCLYRSNKRMMPMVWGVVRCKLLLPADADRWNEVEQGHVLLHELAHVARWDCFAKMLTRLVCAVYWFNPLVWYGLRRLHCEAEVACDDLVIKAGGKPSEYAEQILRIATQLKYSGFTASNSFAMARKATLESRLVAILDGGRNRRQTTRMGFVVAFLLAMGVVLPVSVMQAVEPSTVAGKEVVSAEMEMNEADKPSAVEESGALLSSQEKLDEQEKATRRVDAAMNAEMSVDFRDEPFVSVIDEFQQAAGLTIVVNKQAVKQAGFDLQKPVTLIRSSCQVKWALTKILTIASNGNADNPLDYAVIDGKIVISTREEILKIAPRYLQVYDIHDLLAGEDVAEDGHIYTREEKVEQLITLIRENVGLLNDWQEHGGTLASIEEREGNLVVTATTRIHEDIHEILKTLRLTQNQQSQTDAGNNTFGRIDLGIDNIEVRKVMQLLSKQSNKTIVPSKEVKGNVNLQLKNATFKQVMDAIMWATGYEYVELNGMIYVGTPQEIEQVKEKSPATVIEQPAD